MLINQYSVDENLPGVLLNTRVQSATEEEIRSLMVEQAASKSEVDFYISLAIRGMDPNNPGDDEWYAYHQTLKAIADGLQPVLNSQTYQYLVRYLVRTQIDLTGKPLLSRRSADDIAIIVSGEKDEIMAAHDALIAEGPWRGYWHDPTSPPIERPVYEEIYSVHDWKVDRKRLIDEWGMARYQAVYPLWEQNRDADIIIGLNAKLGYDLFNAAPNAVKNRVPPPSQEAFNRIDLTWDLKHSLAKQVYQSNQLEQVQDAIGDRKQAGFLAYNEVTQGIIDLPGLPV